MAYGYTHARNRRPVSGPRMCPAACVRQDPCNADFCYKIRMFSYRHGFHAGNHADVLKHAVLLHLLDYLGRKDKPFWYVDTHAGAARYDLNEAYARKNFEFETGIGRLWAAKDLPVLLADYVALVRAGNANGALRFYPGSSDIAFQRLRATDKLRLFELHSTESRLLQAHFRSDAPRVLVQSSDGFEGLKSVLPPPTRRALVLLDPSYEDKDDYARLRSALEDALRRFATGVFMVWYPLVQRRESRGLPELLKRLQTKGWLHVTLSVKSPSDDGIGLHGSGLFILNPPWTLPDVLREAMPVLAKRLGQDAGAGYELESALA